MIVANILLAVRGSWGFLLYVLLLAAPVVMRALIGYLLERRSKGKDRIYWT